MNLKSITDKGLLEKTQNLVREERELLTTVLHHLREIDRRRLFSSLGYKSLFEFSVKHLGYPEDQAYRRISAMKLLKELPEIEEKINQGTISLTHIGLAQTLFKQERKILQKELSHTEKLSVFEQIASKPVREAERITLSLSSVPQVPKSDRISQLSGGSIEMKFSGSKELQEKIEKLKGMLAHSNPNMSLGELFEKLCDLGISEWDPIKVAAPRKRRVNLAQSQAQIRRNVFARANNQCENCGSNYALEVDHIRPQALGGKSNSENLRLLCRACNQRAAIKVFGLAKMDRYLNVGL